MLDPAIHNSNLTELRSYADKALAMAPVALNDKLHVPECGGVYIFYNKRSEIIYVGKAGKLRSRIHTDHVSGESTASMSSLRRSLVQVHTLAFGLEMKEWIIANCKIAFVAIDSPDMRSLVEAYLIRCVRTEHLLNKPRKLGPQDVAA